MTDNSQFIKNTLERLEKINFFYDYCKVNFMTERNNCYVADFDGGNGSHRGYFLKNSSELLLRMQFIEMFLCCFLDLPEDMKEEGVHGVIAHLGWDITDEKINDLNVKYEEGLKRIKELKQCGNCTHVTIHGMYCDHDDGNKEKICWNEETYMECWELNKNG